MRWTELETSTYQGHVINHVLGATVLGWVAIEDALHLLLDVGLLWTIYVTGEMSLMAQAVAIQDLMGDDVSQAMVDELADDADRLIADGRDADGLRRFTAAQVQCLVVSVNVFAADALRRILIAGESADLEIQTSPHPPRFTIQLVAS